ncbi:MAG TPA: hydantoinase/oxoprolinase N-terminal domain-containing protein, partial [Gaiellaceae bacterium]|nr:hydantoinase/oxoprolinase N-terminal domain-containing protein [Gaiellaceae bacterium]
MERLIGVDVGGTFTDLVWHDEESGALRVGKEPTSASAPEEGVLDAVAVTLRPDEIGAARLFLHGTTVGLNALLERRGATVGLICSEGFRDVLEVRRGDRDNPYDLFWAPPPPLVPRRRRVPIGGRIAADGTVVRPLDLAGIADAIAIFAAEEVDAVAVAFINAYANPEHELAAEQELRRLGFTGHVSLSHRVSGEYREYERTSTTVVDAFVRRRMGPYLDRLRGGLDGLGFDGDLLITRSGGGAMTFDQALD